MKENRYLADFYYIGIDELKEITNKSDFTENEISGAISKLFNFKKDDAEVNLKKIQITNNKNDKHIYFTKVSGENIKTDILTDRELEKIIKRNIIFTNIDFQISNIKNLHLSKNIFDNCTINGQYFEDYFQNNPKFESIDNIYKQYQDVLLKRHKELHKFKKKEPKDYEKEDQLIEIRRFLLKTLIANAIISFIFVFIKNVLFSLKLFLLGQAAIVLAYAGVVGVPVFEAINPKTLYNKAYKYCKKQFRQYFNKNQNRDYGKLTNVNCS